MTLRESLAGGAVPAVFVSLKDPALPIILKGAGFECLLIDREHGVMGVESAARLVAAARSVALPCITRVPSLTRDAIQDALESGASGVLVPMVESAAQAAQLAAWCRYPPQGSRGVHPLTPATGYGAVTLPAMLAQANRELVVCAQIETLAGLEQVEAIAATPGIDLLFLGPGDLAISMGVAFDDPAVEGAFERILAAAKVHGKAVGTFVLSPERGAQAVRQGARLIAMGVDIGLVQQAGRANTRAWRALISGA